MMIIIISILFILSIGAVARIIYLERSLSHLDAKTSDTVHSSHKKQYIAQSQLLDFQNMVLGSDGIIWRCNSTLNLTEVSPKGLSFLKKYFLGTELEDISILDILDLGEVPHKQRFAQAIETKHAFQNLVLHSKPDHPHKFCCNLSAIPIYTEDKFDGYLGIAFNVTESFVHNRYIRDQQATIELTLNKIRAGIAIIDHNLEHTYFNEKFVEIMDLPTDLFTAGVSLEDLIRYRATRGDYGHGRVEDIVKERLNLILNTDFQDVQQKFPHGRTVSLSKILLPNQQFALTLIDDTDRLKAQAKINRLGRALEYSKFEIIIANARSFNLIQTTHSAAAHLKIEGKELHDLNVCDFFEGYTPQKLRDTLKPILQGQTQMIRLEETLTPLTGNASPAELYIQHQEDDIEPTLLIAMTDMSEQRALEETLRNAKEEAELASRTKSEFLANMSHELRTPLNAILGFSEILSNEMFGPLGVPQYKDYVTDIKESGAHLLGLINEILDVSKADAGKLELRENKTNILSIIQDTVRILRQKAIDDHIKVDIISDQKIPLIWGDERRLKQIILNLISNAIKFTPENGHIHIVTALCDKTGLSIEIQDNGIGIPKQDISRILQPFTQIDSKLARKYNGTGLGLPLAKTMIELHQGTLHIDSTLGKGTTVTITLPPERLIQTKISNSSTEESSSPPPLEVDEMLNMLQKS